MLAPRQFSLRYLLLEMAWLAVALVATRLALGGTAGGSPFVFLFAALAAVGWGVFFGGCFGRMWEGAIFSAAVAFPCLLLV